MTKLLAGMLRMVKRDQDYMRLREKVHIIINEDTNRTVVLWSSFEASLLVVMTISQVYYLQRFFEVRCIV